MRGLWAAPAVVAALALGLSACGRGGRTEETGDQEEALQWDASGETVVVLFDEHAPMVTPPDAPPLLRIFGDGTVRVHYPEASAKAGDYEGDVTDAALRELLRDLEALGVMAFDAEAVRGEVRAAQRAREPGAPIPVVMDAATTRLVIRLERYVAPGQAEAETDVVKEIKWYALDFDARTYPGVEKLRDLQQAAERLKRVADDVRSGKL